MWEHIGTIVVVAGFVIHLVCTIVGGTWALSQLKASMIQALTAHQKEVDEEFAVVRREMGEMGSALRQKINEVELFGRDVYVRREGFYKVKDELSDAIKDLGDKIDARLDRMETKIDSKT